MLNSVQDVIREVIDEHGEEIISIVQNKQLGQGIDSFGRDLIHPSKRGVPSRVPLYEPSTENYYAKIPPIPRKSKITDERYNFEWTGRHFDTMKIKHEIKAFEILSNDKELDLIYGTTLNDLTPENLEFVNKNILEPELIKWIEDNWWRLIT